MVGWRPAGRPVEGLMRYTIQVRHSGTGGVATEAAIQAALEQVLGTAESPVEVVIPAYQGPPGVYTIELEAPRGKRTRSGSGAANPANAGGRAGSDQRSLVWGAGDGEDPGYGNARPPRAHHLR